MPFRNPIVAGEELVVPALRSEDWSDTAAGGWRLGRNGIVQFTNAGVFNDLGVGGILSAKTILLEDTEDALGILLANGDSLTETLLQLDLKTSSSPENPQPGQVIKAIQFPITSVTASNSTTSEIGIVEIDTGIITVTGWYEFSCDALLFNNSNANAVTNFTQFRYTSTSNGTTPSNPIASSSSILGRATFDHHSSTGQYMLGPSQITRYLTAGFRYRVLLTYGVSVATTTMNLINTSVLWGATLKFVGTTSDTSGITGATGTGISLSAGGGTEAPPPAPAPAPTKHVTTFYATWSRSYDANLATRLGDDTPYCYQGYVSGTHGDTRSLAGFDYAAIQSALSGATSITAVAGFKVAHTYNSSGTPFKVGAHNYTSKPATWNGANVFESVIGTKTGVAGTAYTIALDATDINNFKSGAYKGLAFGPYGANSTAGYGYLYGATQTGKPYITFTYYK